MRIAIVIIIIGGDNLVLAVKQTHLRDEYSKPETSLIDRSLVGVI